MGKTFSTGLLTNGIWQDASNNIGIGGSPSGSYKLEVTGTAKVSSTLLVSGAATFSSSVNIGTAGSEKLNIFGAGSQFINVKNTTSGADMFVGMSSALAAAFIGTGGTDPIVFSTAGTEKMRISSGGNLFVGTLSDREKFNLNGNTALINFDTYSTSLSRSIIYYSNTISYGLQPIANINFLTQGDAASAITFVTRADAANYAERMRITSGGEVCIGTTTANYYGLLNLQGSLNSYNVLTIKDTGTTYSSSKYYQLYLNSTDGIAGGVYHATASTVGFYTGPSDQRLKSNIKDWDESVLPFFAAAKPKTYNHTADEDESVVYKGFLAQDMVDNFPEVYGLGADGYYQNNPTAYIPYLVKAIQELSAQNQDLKSRLDKAGL